MNYRLMTAALTAAVTLTPLSLPLAAAEPTPAPQPEATVNIIGGGTATQDTSWLGYLTVTCGASVIAERWLVTAAHCLVADDPFGSPAEVRLGSKHDAEGGVVMKNLKEFRHPNYPKTLENSKRYDIGLLKLPSPYTGGKIPLATQHVPVGTHTRILGWGAEDAELTKFPHLVKALDTSVRADDACKSATGVFMPGFEYCTDHPNNQGACNGDSGGPQITLVDGKWTLIGVTSRGGATCATSPSVYTDVFAYKQWILDTVRAEDGALPPELAAWDGGRPSTPSPSPTVTPTSKPTPTSTPTSKPTKTPAPTPTRPAWWPTRWPWPPR